MNAGRVGPCSNVIQANAFLDNIFPPSQTEDMERSVPSDRRGHDRSDVIGPISSWQNFFSRAIPLADLVSRSVDYKY